MVNYGGINKTFNNISTMASMFNERVKTKEWRNVYLIFYDY